jgi:hypothetical protein
LLRGSGTLPNSKNSLKYKNKIDSYIERKKQSRWNQNAKARNNGQWLNGYI